MRCVRAFLRLRLHSSTLLLMKKEYPLLDE
jgi:hypothetical protein